MAKADYVVQKFIDLLGADATLALLEYGAGCKIYIPSVIATGNAPGNIIELQLGQHAAANLIKEFSGEYIRVPLGRYWRAQIYRERELSIREIAIKLGVGENTAYRYLSLAGMSGDKELNDRTMARARRRMKVTREKVKAASQ